MWLLRVIARAFIWRIVGNVTRPRRKRRDRLDPGDWT
jgi:hypothetical protein